MSVYSLTPVWKRSQASGNDLLVLLALADMANDGEGFAFARVTTVAKQARLSKSACYERIDALIELGELREFKRGHYRSPAFIIPIVDTPLDDDGIRDRLADLDDASDWYEYTPAGDQTPFLMQRSSGIRTISQNDTAVSQTDVPKDPDQEVYPHHGRETSPSDPSEEIVRNQDDLTDTHGEIVRNPDKIVRPAGQDRPASRTTYEPSYNRDITTTAAAAGVDSDPDTIARRWCELTGRRYAGRIPEVYRAQVRRFLEEHPPPTAEFLEKAHAEGIKHPSGWRWVDGAVGSQARDLPDCVRCANKRLVAKLPNGQLGPLDSPEDYDTVVHCPACMFVGEKTG